MVGSGIVGPAEGSIDMTDTIELRLLTPDKIGRGGSRIPRRIRLESGDACRTQRAHGPHRPTPGSWTVNTDSRRAVAGAFCIQGPGLAEQADRASDGEATRRPKGCI